MKWNEAALSVWSSGVISPSALASLIFISETLPVIQLLTRPNVALRLVPPAPLSTIIKSVFAIDSPMSVPPSISNVVISPS